MHRSRWPITPARRRGVQWPAAMSLRPPGDCAALFRPNTETRAHALHPAAARDHRPAGARRGAGAGGCRSAAPPATDRAVLLPPLKAALARGRDEIRRRFEAGGPAARAVAEQSFLIDQLIRVLYDFAVETVYPLANPTEGEKMAIVAVGGYGRGELAPYSDIDLLFLLPYKRRRTASRSSSSCFTCCGISGSRSGSRRARSPSACATPRDDLTIRTALLEARYLWGEQALYGELKQAFENDIQRGTAAQFVEAKLAERDARHVRVGDSRYQLEPNIKEGKGGLRDLHTLFWIAKYIYRVDDVAKLVDLGVLSAEESARFQRAQSFLWTVRCHLHYLAGRAEERLTFDMQREIGARMGYTDRPGSRGVERFMKHYFLVAKDVGDLTRIFCAVLEAEQQRKRRVSWLRWGPTDLWRRRALGGFTIEGERLTIPSEDFFKKDPVALIRLFHVAQEHDLDIHPRALRAVTQSLRLIDAKLRDDPEANRLFLEILTSKQEPGNRAAADERGRRVRQVRARFRPRRGADAVRHVPRLHGRRAHAVRDRHPAPDRDRQAEGRIAGRQRDHADRDLAPRALCRDAAARHRQGARRRPFRDRREDRAEARAAPRA